MHKWAGFKPGLTFGGKISDTIKAHAHCEGAPFFGQIMATSHPTEMQTEVEEMTVQAVVKEITEIKVEEDVDYPLEGLTNADVADIYKKLRPEDKRLFRQFKHFHKTYYNLHGHNAPSHQLAKGIVSEIFSGLPACDAETIANAHAELLTAE